MLCSSFIRLEKVSKFSNFLFRNYSVVFCSQQSNLKLQFKQRLYKYDYFKYENFHVGYVNHGIMSDFVTSDLDQKKFNDAYEIVRKAFLFTNDKAVSDAVNWSAEVLDYNVHGGKQIRGISTLKAFKVLSDELSSDRELEACLLGWCVEMLQAFLIILDDIMDNSTTRRGKPCWYKNPSVGLMAVNDGLLLESGIYKILELYFKDHKAYSNLLQEFLQATRKTIYGQCLDMLNVPSVGKPRFENFSLEKYKAIVEYKTSKYTFCLPVHLAMHLVGHFSDEEFKLTEEICSKLGLLFQIQDDYLDAFGDAAITGKIGTDISDGKCTWFSASVFESAPEHMKKHMIENYGVNEENSVSQVMKIYEELHLEEKYFKCEQELISEISLMIETLPRDSLQSLFHLLLKNLYHRKK